MAGEGAPLVCCEDTWGRIPSAQRPGCRPWLPLVGCLTQPHAGPSLTPETGVSDSRPSPGLGDRNGLITYDRLYRVAGGVEGQSICVHAGDAAGARRARGSGCQAGGDARRDA